MSAIGEPSGPIEKGTTYIVRPFMQPLKRPFSVVPHLAGSRQLLVGPASSSLLGADEGAVLDPGDVGGVGEGEVGVGTLGVGEALEGARRRPASARASRTPRPSRRTSGRSRAASAPRSRRPSRAVWRWWSARGPWSSRSFASLYLFDLTLTRLEVGVLVEDLQCRGGLLAVGEVHGASEGRAGFDHLAGRAADGVIFS